MTFDRLNLPTSPVCDIYNTNQCVFNIAIHDGRNLAKRQHFFRSLLNKWMLLLVLTLVHRVISAYVVCPTRKKGQREVIKSNKYLYPDIFIKNIRKVAHSNGSKIFSGLTATTVPLFSSISGHATQL